MAADGSSSREQARALLREFSVLDPAEARYKAVRDELVEMHMPLVIYLARRFADRSEPLADLIQVGVIGLMKAVDRFDVDRGLEFSTYATPTILGEIKRHFRDTGWLVHVPRRAQELQTRLNAARETLGQELGRSPTVREIAARLEVDYDIVLEALDAARGYAGVPLELLTPPGESAPEHPRLGVPDDRYELVEQREMLRGVIGSLPEREQEILALRFIENRTQSEIARRVGLSQMHVSRLIARSLATLRSQLTDPADAGHRQHLRPES